MLLILSKFLVGVTNQYSRTPLTVLSSIFRLTINKSDLLYYTMQKIQQRQINSLNTILDPIVDKVNELKNSLAPPGLETAVFFKYAIPAENIDVAKNILVINKNDIQGEPYYILNSLFFINGLKQEESTFVIFSKNNTYEIFCDFNIDINWSYSIVYIGESLIEYKYTDVYKYDFGGNEVSDPIFNASFNRWDIYTNFENYGDNFWVVKDFASYYNSLHPEMGLENFVDYTGDHTHMNDLTKGYFGVYNIKTVDNYGPYILFNLDKSVLYDVEYEFSFYAINLIKPTSSYYRVPSLNFGLGPVELNSNEWTKFSTIRKIENINHYEGNATLQLRIDILDSDDNYDIDSFIGIDDIKVTKIDKIT